MKMISLSIVIIFTGFGNMLRRIVRKVKRVLIVEEVPKPEKRGTAEAIPYSDSSSGSYSDDTSYAPPVRKATPTSTREPTTNAAGRLYIPPRVSSSSSEIPPTAVRKATGSSDESEESSSSSMPVIRTTPAEVREAREVTAQQRARLREVKARKETEEAMSRMAKEKRAESAVNELVKKCVQCMDRAVDDGKDTITVYIKSSLYIGLGKEGVDTFLNKLSDRYYIVYPGNAADYPYQPHKYEISEHIVEYEPSTYDRLANGKDTNQIMSEYTRLLPHYYYFRIGMLMT